MNISKMGKKRKRISKSSKDSELIQLPKQLLEEQKKILELHQSKIEQLLHQFNSIRQPNNKLITNTNSSSSSSKISMSSIRTLTSQLVHDSEFQYRNGTSTSVCEPMVFKSFIQTGLLDTDHNGLMYICIPFHQNPTHSFVPQPYRAIGFSRLQKHQTIPYTHEITMFNTNPMRREVEGRKVNFKELCARLLPGAPITEEQFMDELHKPTGSRRKVMYLRDITGHNMWKDRDVNQTESAAIKIPESIDITEDWQSYGFVNYHDDIVKKCIPNPLNTNLFPYHPRSSLLSLLPLATVLPFENENQNWSSLQFPGLDRAFSYCSMNSNFFQMHREQLMFSFWNVCYAGQKIWYFIPECEQQKLEQYVIREFKNRNPTISNTSTTVTPDEDQLILALLFAKNTTFLDPRDLITHGIQVIRIVQNENEIITAKGTIFHWGLTAHHYAINEAINYIPIHWLVSGLPQVIGFIQWLIQYLKIKEASAHTALLAILNERVEVMLTNNVPRIWTLAFIHYVREDLLLAKSQYERETISSTVTGSSCSNNYSTSDSHCSGSNSSSSSGRTSPKLVYSFTHLQYSQIVSNLEELERLLFTPQLVTFYQKYSEE
jgi:hypothetical protein